MTVQVNNVLVLVILAALAVIMIYIVMQQGSRPMTPSRLMMMGSAVCFILACLGVGLAPWVPLGLLFMALAQLVG